MSLDELRKGAPHRSNQARVRADDTRAQLKPRSSGDELEVTLNPGGEAWTVHLPVTGGGRMAMEIPTSMMDALVGKVTAAQSEARP